MAAEGSSGTAVEEAEARPGAGAAEASGSETSAGTASAAEARPRGLRVFRILRHREFALFWYGHVISLVGTWMQNFAQGWVVATLTPSAFALGLLNFAMALPTLILMPIAGVVADRVERRRILLYAQWVLLLLAVASGALVASGRLELWHLYVVAVLLGIVTAYELPAYQSFYPQLIERDELPQAISLNQATFNGSRIVGPALAAWIIAAWGTASAFYANAASFLAVIASLLLIRPRPPAVASSPRGAASMMREGIQYVRERPEVQVLLGLTGITTFCIFPNLAVLMPFYALHVLHVGAGGLGVIMSVSGAGSMVGSVLLLSVPRERRRLVIAASAATIFLAMGVLAWSQALWVSAVATAFQSLAISLSIGLVSVMIQETVPDELRGRVMSLYSMMFVGVMPFAALAITKLADGIGMRTELQLAGLLYAAVAFFLIARLPRGRATGDA